MNAQEILDTVITNLRRQGKVSFKSTALGPKCAYRGDNGTKCAGGWLIQDQEYAPWMDGDFLDFGGVLGHRDCPQSLVERLNPYRSLIVDLQEIHDEGMDNKENCVPIWESEWKALADYHGLKYPSTDDST